MCRSLLAVLVLAAPVAAPAARVSARVASTLDKELSPASPANPDASFVPAPASALYTWSIGELLCKPDGDLAGIERLVMADQPVPFAFDGHVVIECRRKAHRYQDYKRADPDTRYISVVNHRLELLYELLGASRERMFHRDVSQVQFADPN